MLEDATAFVTSYNIINIIRPTTNFKRLFFSINFTQRKDFLTV